MIFFNAAEEADDVCSEGGIGEREFFERQAFSLDGNENIFICIWEYEFLVDIAEPVFSVCFRNERITVALAVAAERGINDRLICGRIIAVEVELTLACDNGEKLIVCIFAEILLVAVEECTHTCERVPVEVGSEVFGAYILAVEL